ncbi:MAG TPA: DUF1553 domain-containing protein [Tepidisphaeraceae bacterium]|nr:DUF1553 domain-containing protein [Tepidisphaeraceae bacterium]
MKRQIRHSLLPIPTLRWMGLVIIVGLAMYLRPAYAASDPAHEWAFQPVSRPAIPGDSNASWVRNPIDAFVYARMKEQGLSPAPPASKAELLRRVTYDLTGLPPTWAEISAFLADDSPSAYEKVVDRLLASPRYGERWGKHWLDVVRFGESNGYEQNHLRPSAWPYRDYCIAAFNDDKPYDQFITEQLAGDVVADGNRDIEAATGFLVAGVHDTVGIATVQGTRQQRATDLDDIVSTTGATFLGLTVGCAHCHDHKFDPIPQRDYYRLMAVFAGVHHGERGLPVKRSPDEQRDMDAVAGRINDVTAQLAAIDAQAKQAAAVASSHGANSGHLRPPVSAQRNVDDFAPVPAKFVRFTILATIDGTEPCIDELEIFPPGGTENLGLASRGAKATASSLLPGFDIHKIDHLNDGKFGNSQSWISNEPGKGWAQIELSAPATIGRVSWSRDNSPQPKFSDRVASKYQIAVSLDGEHWQIVASSDDRQPPANAAPDLDQYLTPAARQHRQILLAELESLKKRDSAFARPKAYIGIFSNPDEIHLLKRGDVMQPMEVVAAGALSRIPGLSADFPADPKLDPSAESTRRLGLARWICQRENPLTARVMVNRLWQHHFGRGIVATPSDFGTNGSAPTHPALLDWLADDFMQNGWRIKRLQRMIVLSNTYRQSSQASADALAKDAGNIWLSHMPLMRLEAEAVRDSILADSGKLDLSMGGPGYPLFKYRVVNVAIYEPLEIQGPQTWRRAIYQTSARAIHDELLGSFNEPECALREPRRETTTTPLQALTLLNSNFVNDQATFFADRVKREMGTDADAQVRRAFQIAFGREPGGREAAAASVLVREHGLQMLCRALFNANEFLDY